MILSGKELAARIEIELQKQIATSKITPCIAVILVGSDPASEIYITRKRAAAERVGAQFELHHETNATTESLIVLMQSLNARPDVHGILMQLPLPPGFDTDKIINAMDPAKDVDGFHPENIAAFMEDRPQAHLPVLLRAVQLLLAETKTPVEGKHAVIVGKSDVFLYPMTHLLELLGLTVTWVKPERIAEQEQTQRADVLIVAVGIPGIITADKIKPGAIIIDIGINRTAEGKVVGDVDYENCAPLASWITPTPGGVGPVTIASVFLSLTQLAQDAQ